MNCRWKKITGESLDLTVLPEDEAWHSGLGLFLSVFLCCLSAGSLYSRLMHQFFHLSFLLNMLDLY